MKYKVIEKDDKISWNTIHEVIKEAHSENISKGINMRTTRLSGSELKDRVGDGKCFIAVDADEKVVATAAVSIKITNFWFAKGRRVASYMLLAILPECRGAGVMKMLDEKRLEFVKQNNLDVIIMDTAESNTKMIEIKQAHGYKKVYMFKSQYSKHNSVVMAQWLGQCPYSDLYIKFRYQLISLKIRTKKMLKSIIRNK